MTNIVENNKHNKKLTKYEQYFNRNKNIYSQRVIKGKETNKIATTLKITKREQPRHDLNKTTSHYNQSLNLNKWTLSWNNKRKKKIKQTKSNNKTNLNRTRNEPRVTAGSEKEHVKSATLDNESAFLS